MTALAQYAAALSLLIGSGFVLVGAIGLLKFNEPMTRLHAPTKGWHGWDWYAAFGIDPEFSRQRRSVDPRAFDHGFLVRDSAGFRAFHRQGLYSPAGL